MKFTTTQKQFSSSLSFVSRAVPGRPTHPILANVKLQAKGDTITLTAFDLSMGIEVDFDALIQMEGVITLPAKLLGDIVSRLPDSEIIFELNDDNNLMMIESSSGRYTIPAMVADEYPELPTLEDGESVKIEPDALIQGLKATVDFASSDETKQVLTGVRIVAKDNTFETASTNSHYLSILNTTLKNTCIFEATIPTKPLRQIMQVVKDEIVNIKFDQSLIIFEIGNTKITTRLLEGQYPNYQQLIPKQFSLQATVDRKNLIDSLDRISVLAESKNNVVKLTFNSNELTITVDAQDVGSGKELVNCVCTADVFEIAFNVNYLMQGLKNMDTAEVILNMNTATSPVVVNPVGGAKQTFLSMPVQCRQ